MQLRNWGWFIIIQKTRPLIGQVNVEEELRILEEKCNETYGAYKDQLDTKARLEEENVKVKDEAKALMQQIESEQGNLSQYTERQAKASAQKADIEFQLQDAQEKLANLEQARQSATTDKKTLEQENQTIKKDIENCYRKGIVKWKNVRVGEWSKAAGRMTLMGAAVEYQEHFDKLLGH